MASQNVKFIYAAMGILLEYAQASFDAMDKAGDGKITMDGFLHYHVEYFFPLQCLFHEACVRLFPEDSFLRSARYSILHTVLEFD